MTIRNVILMVQLLILKFFVQWKMMHKIKFYLMERKHGLIYGAEKGNWQILKGFIIQVRPTSAKSDRDLDCTGNNFKKLSILQVKDPQEF